MEWDLKALGHCPLFAGVGAEQRASLLACLGAKTKVYSRGEVIFQAGGPATHAGVVLCGMARVCRDGADGNRAVLAAIEPGGLFGEAYACAGCASLPVSVWAEAESAILLLDIGKVVTTCPSACTFHTVLIVNLLRVLAEKNIFLTGKMEHLAKRTLGEKLLSYLGACAAAAGGGTFTVPFDRQGLADYLCADRSALSRELGNLRRQGILEFEKNRFRLL